MTGSSTSTEEHGKATKRPWEIKRSGTTVDGAYDYAIIADIDGRKRVIAEVFGRVAEDIWPAAEANAALIVQAVNERDQLLAQAERAWRPIRTAPKMETVLVAGGDAIYPVTASWSGERDECWWVDGQEDTHCEIGWPTHWMPLPNSPTQREG